MRNLILVNCIGFFGLMILTPFGLDKFERKWNKILLQSIAMAIGGCIGGFTGWYINDLLFGFNVSSPIIFPFFIAALSIFFGLISSIFMHIWEKLKKTAAELSAKELNGQRLLRLKTKAELEALRAKVNPHFLFNTINSISGLIHEDPDKADDMLQKLSNLFRYTLDISNCEFIKLIDEVKIIESYLEIEKVRLGNRLSYQIEMDKRIQHILIPGMLLQPLIENSIKHTIAPNKSGGNILLCCRSDNNWCKIQIRDSGSGFTETATENGFGLKSVKERLSLYYGNNYRLKISSNPEMEIQISLPVDNQIALNQE